MTVWREACYYCGALARGVETLTYRQEGVLFENETRKVCESHGS